MLISAGQAVAARPPEDPCIWTVTVPDGSTVSGRTPDCTEFLPQRVFEGLWVNDFEGSLFFEGGRTLADVPVRTPVDDIWFQHDRATRFPKVIPLLVPGHVFRVRFRGHAAAYLHREPMLGYGHMGSSSGLVVADDILSIEDLGPVPR